MPLKTWNGLARANLKSYNGLLSANWKTWNGLSIPVTDPSWASVQLLAVNDNAADGTTTFIDQSAAAHTLTAVGNAQYDSAQAPTGMTTTCLGDGTGDRVDSGQSADFRLVTTSTLEYMIRFNAKGVGMRQITMTHSGGKIIGIICSSGGDSSKIELNHFGVAAIIVSATGLLANGVWYHVALTTAAGTTTLWLDGTSVGTVADPFLAQDITVQMMGNSTYTGSELNGWISNVRLTKGVSRYSGSFTPPTLPMPTS